MRILAFSDLHRDAARAEAIVNESHGADVVVGAGDFASCGQGHEDTLNVLRRMTVPFVLVPGNHDDLGALFAACADWPLAHLLHGQSVVIDGVPFFGIGLGSGVIDPEPWNMVLDEAEAEQMLTLCPARAVLVSHSPPHGIADQQRHCSTPAPHHDLRPRPQCLGPKRYDRADAGSQYRPQAEMVRRLGWAGGCRLHSVRIEHCALPPDFHGTEIASKI